jgi:hypothetical protein
MSAIGVRIFKQQYQPLADRLEAVISNHEALLRFGVLGCIKGGKFLGGSKAFDNRVTVRRQWPRGQF